jgi:hypothetical protein
LGVFLLLLGGRNQEKRKLQTIYRRKLKPDGGRSNDCWELNFFENPASLQLSFALGEKIVDAIVGTIRHS